ncbi:hypothetical protein BJ508DRAFT_335105, partial [Ascobolus immersus RN42]
MESEIRSDTASSSDEAWESAMEFVGDGDSEYGADASESGSEADDTMTPTGEKGTQSRSPRNEEDEWPPEVQEWDTWLLGEGRAVIVLPTEGIRNVYPSSPVSSPPLSPLPNNHLPLTPSRVPEEQRRLQEYLQLLADKSKREEEESDTDDDGFYLADWRITDPSAPRQRVPGSYNWLGLQSLQIYDVIEPSSAQSTQSLNSVTPLGSSTPRFEQVALGEKEEPDLLSALASLNLQGNSVQVDFTTTSSQNSTKSVSLSSNSPKERKVLPPTMSVYTSTQPLITFSNGKGELIEEVFEAIDTEEELRIDALESTVLDDKKRTSAAARGSTLKKMRLRQSLGGEALEYYLSLTSDIRMDYERSKKALIRRFGDQIRTPLVDKKEDARWSAIA